MTTTKRLNVFERYLSLWVGLCMVAGVIIGAAVPGLTDALRRLEFAQGSHINVPIAILIWLMITPMMMKVDLGAIRDVGRRPAGLVITLVVNWLVKPFSMAAIAYLFFRVVFAPWITAADADQYIAGTIILAAAPCTAMVFVWSYLTDGDPAYTLVQVSVNDLIMLVLAPIVRYLVSGASSLRCTCPSRSCSTRSSSSSSSRSWPASCCGPADREVAGPGSSATCCRASRP